MSGYILNREGIQREEKNKLFRQRDLELMTTYQLREICRKEKLVQGIMNPMDKEELIHVIMRYRGTREQLLILEEVEDGSERLGFLLKQGRINVKKDKALYIPSKIVVFEGLAMDENDRIYIPFHSEMEDTNALLVSGGREICGIFHLKKERMILRTCL